MYVKQMLMVSLGSANVVTNKEKYYFISRWRCKQRKNKLFSSGASGDTFLSVAPEGITKKKVLDVKTQIEGGKIIIGIKMNNNTSQNKHE